MECHKTQYLVLCFSPMLSLRDIIIRALYVMLMILSFPQSKTKLLVDNENNHQLIPLFTNHVCRQCMKKVVNNISVDPLQSGSVGTLTCLFMRESRVVFCLKRFPH